MSKADKTLKAIFDEPARPSIPWRDIEAMLKHYGAEVTEGSGSRVRFELHGRVLSEHRPHPRKEAGRRRTEKVRQFLVEIGIMP